MGFLQFEGRNPRSVGLPHEVAIILVAVESNRDPTLCLLMLRTILEAAHP